MIKYEVHVYPSGNEYWYLNGQRHRENGPALTYADGTKWWYFNGKLHRENGPAIEDADGTTKGWYLNGEKYTKEGHAKEIARRNAPATPATPPSCAGKVVEIEGKKYKLQEIA